MMKTMKMMKMINDNNDNDNDNINNDNNKTDDNHDKLSRSLAPPCLFRHSRAGRVATSSGAPYFKRQQTWLELQLPSLYRILSSTLN